jgi:hypothetical protein
VKNVTVVGAVCAGSDWVSPTATYVANFLDRPARSRYCIESTAASHRGFDRVSTLAEGARNRPKRNHRQLVLGLLIVVGVHGSGGGAPARDPSDTKFRPLAIVDALEGGGDEMDRVALAMNSSTSSSRSRTKPYRPHLRRRATVTRAIGDLITSM